jgi:CubicO group peptidase (beta-lactamase class C family)
MGKTLEALVRKELDSAREASLAIGVVSKDGKSVTSYFNEIFDGVQPGDYVFEIGSTTKTFTSLLLAILVKEGKVSLDDPVKNYKPGYEKALSLNGKDITFRHLAVHRSGLPREDMKKLRQRIKENKEEKDNPFKYFTEADLHEFYTNHQPKREVEKKWQYSNIGIGLLGNTLAEIEEMPFEDAVRTRILEPLGMDDTFITGTPEQNSRYVKAYNKKGERVPPIELAAINGAGALKSTLNDMLIYLEHQTGLTDSHLKEAIELTHQIHGKTSAKKIKMGLGWMIEEKKWSQYPVIHHGGTTIGFHTYCAFIKEIQAGVVIFSTIQLRPWRIIKMLTNIEGLVNENIAKELFKEELMKAGTRQTD